MRQNKCYCVRSLGFGVICSTAIDNQCPIQQIPYSDESEWTTATRNDSGEFHKHNDMQKKPDTKKETRCDFLIQRSKHTQN